MCKYNSFSRRKSFSLLKTIKHIHLKSIQTAAGKGEQGQYQVSPSVTQRMIVRQQRCEGQGRATANTAEGLWERRGQHATCPCYRLSPCCLARVGNRARHELFGQCAHLEEERYYYGTERLVLQRLQSTDRSEHARRGGPTSQHSRVLETTGTQMFFEPLTSEALV